MNIDYLLNKYDDEKYVKGLYETPEQQQKRKQKNRIQQRLHTLNQLLKEEPKLRLNKNEKDQVEYLIKKCDNFHKIFIRAQTETILLAFIFYVKLNNDSKIKISEWRICKQYKLTERNYSIIISRVLNIILKEQPLPITQTTNYDHNILEKQSL